MIVPVARAFVRYWPFRFGRRAVWERVLEPYRIWDEHQFVARTRFGARLAGSTAELIDQRIYIFGTWEPNLTAWLTKRLQPGDTFVDVGANIGYFSLLASKLVGPSGRVVAIEASPATFEQLGGNVRRNRCANVRTINIAAGDRVDTVTLYRGPVHHIGHSSVVDPADFPAEAEVEMRPLDNALTEEELATARVVKIDVEGAEALVVDGLQHLLQNGRRDLEIVLEIGERRLAQQGRHAEELFDVFQRAGFLPYAIANDYEASAYFEPKARAPLPLSGVIHEGDVIFSRLSPA